MKSKVFILLDKYEKSVWVIIVENTINYGILLNYNLTIAQIRLCVRASGKLPKTLRQNMRIPCIENHPKSTGEEKGGFLGNLSK